MTETYYACAAKTGREYEARDELARITDWAWVATELRSGRFGRSSEFQWSERPLWPGYVFARLGADAFFEARTIKALHPTKLALRYHDVHGAWSASLNRRVGGLFQIADAVETALQRKREEIEAQTTPEPDFASGDPLQIISGPFADRMASFASIVRRSGRKGYDVQAHLDGLPVPVLINPAHVRAAE